MKAAARAEEARQGMYTGWESPVNTQHIGVVGYYTEGRLWALGPHPPVSWPCVEALGRYMHRCDSAHFHRPEGDPSHEHQKLMGTSGAQ